MRTKATEQASERAAQKRAQTNIWKLEKAFEVIDTDEEQARELLSQLPAELVKKILICGIKLHVELGTATEQDLALLAELQAA